MSKTPTDFYTEYLGKSIDDDGAYGVQCVDGYRVFMRWIGETPYITRNNYADGYWYYRDADGAHRWFEYITDPNQLQDGDWVMWGKTGHAQPSASHPLSHIAMYYHGMQFGQNQGSKMFSLIPCVWTDMCGAFRWKEWSNMVTVSKGLNEITYKGVPFYVVKGYKDTNGMDFTQLYMLSAPGIKPLTSVQTITKFDSNQMYVLAMANCNYFEMGDSFYGMHYGVEQSDGDGINSQPIDFAPTRNAELMVFYQKKDGTCGYCKADKYKLSKSEVLFACSPYSVVYHDGQAINERSTCYTNKELANTMQTGYCMTADGVWHIITSRSATTPAVVTALMGEIGAQEGFICDGGGSTQIVYIGKAYINTLRNIPNVLALSCFKEDTELLEPYEEAEDEEEETDDVDTSEVEALRIEINGYKEEIEALKAKIQKAKEALS